MPLAVESYNFTMFSQNAIFTGDTKNDQARFAFKVELEQESECAMHHSEVLP